MGPPLQVSLLDGAAAIVGRGAAGGDLPAPAVGLAIEGLEIETTAEGKECRAQIADRALDSPLFVAAAGSDRPRVETVMIGEREQTGVEADRFARALEHGTLEMVIEQMAGNAAEAGKGSDVSRQKAGQAGVVEKPHEEPAREAQYHDEGLQGTLTARHFVLAEVRPIDLRLLAWERTQLKKGFTAPAWPQTQLGNPVTEVVGSPGVAALAGHVIELARRQLRVSRQQLAQPRQIAVELRGAPTSRLHHCQPPSFESPPHRAVMQTEVASDGVASPALDAEQAANLRHQLGGDHRRRLERRARGGPVGADSARSRLA